MFSYSGSCRSIAASTKPFHTSLSLASCSSSLIPRSLRSSLTRSIHRCLRYPLGRFLSVKYPFCNFMYSSCVWPSALLMSTRLSLSVCFHEFLLCLTHLILLSALCFIHTYSLPRYFWIHRFYIGFFFRILTISFRLTLLMPMPHQRTDK